MNGPFDDSQQKDRRKTTRDPSTDTSTFDAYRQGVELTQTKYYAMGMYKIHAGFHGETGNHTIPQMVLGQEYARLREDLIFEDRTKFVPTSLFK